jgi:hypothetical protein
LAGSFTAEAAAVVIIQKWKERHKDVVGRDDTAHVEALALRPSS